MFALLFAAACGGADPDGAETIKLSLGLGAERSTEVEFHFGMDSEHAIGAGQHSGVVQILSAEPHRLELQSEMLRPIPVPNGIMNLRMGDGPVPARFVLLSRLIGSARKGWAPFRSVKVDAQGRWVATSVFSSSRIDTVKREVTLGNGLAVFTTPGLPREEYLLLPVPLWSDALQTGQHFRYKVDVEP